MQKKMFLVLASLILIVSTLAGCSSTAETSALQQTTSVTATTQNETAAAQSANYPPIDLNPTKALSVSAEGVQAIAPSELSLTDEEIAKLKAGNYTAAFCYHTQSDTCNQTKLATATMLLESWGIKVISVTDANFKAETQVSDIESTMALKPSVLFVMPFDGDAAASALNANVKGSDTKIVFMENVATGYKAGTDYVAVASSDSYGNGKAAADIMAKELGYKGKVAMMFYDLDFYVTNERDRGFRETIQNNYPDIQIVMEAGFTDVNNTGTVADAIFAKYPDINGIFASWDIPAEGAIATANSLGRTDVVITCCDLGDTAARMLATDGMIRGTGAPRSSEQGKAEAYAAAYGLLGKPLPSTFITPPALPVVKTNLLQAYFDSYGIEAPQELKDLLK